jgi:hypothetical protein
MLQWFGEHCFQMNSASATVQRGDNIPYCSASHKLLLPLRLHPPKSDDRNQRRTVASLNGFEPATYKSDAANVIVRSTCPSMSVRKELKWIHALLLRMHSIVATTDSWPCFGKGVEGGEGWSYATYCLLPYSEGTPIACMSDQRWSVSIVGIKIKFIIIVYFNYNII